MPRFLKIKKTCATNYCALVGFGLPQLTAFCRIGAVFAYSSESYQLFRCKVTIRSRQSYRRRNVATRFGYYDGSYAIFLLWR